MSATTRPGLGDSTTTRSARYTASEIECVTSRIVVAVRSQRVEQLRVEALAGQRIKRAERLVEEQHRRPKSASARAMDTRWRIPPDKACGRAPGELAKPDQAEQIAHLLLPAAPRPAGELQRVLDVPRGVAPRQQPWLLEHETDPRVGTGHRRPVELDRAAVGGQEPGHQPQQRALAAPVRPDDRDDLSRQARRT